MKRIFNTLSIAALTGLFAFGPMASTAEAGKLAAWDKIIEPEERFTKLAAFDKEAVLDNETQLVWERKPGETDGEPGITEGDLMYWGTGDNGSGVGGGALKHCANQIVGGRQGWKLPSFDQLASLIDQNSPLCPGDEFDGACLPEGHPFKGVAAGGYWSATTLGADQEKAWKVSFRQRGEGPEFVTVGQDKDDTVGHVWCVRSGQTGASTY